MCTLTGTVSVEGDVQNVIIHAYPDAEHGFRGQVGMGGRLLGTLEVNDVNSAGKDAAILIDGNVIGDVLVVGPMHRDLVVNGAVESSGTIDLSSSVAEDGLVTVADGLQGTLDCAAVSGQVDIRGEVDGSLDLGNINGHVNFWNGFDGTLTAIALGGELFVDGDPNDPNQGLNGTVTLSGDVLDGASIEIDAPAGLAGSLSVGDVLGTIHVTGDVSGALVINGCLVDGEAAGVVQIDGDVVVGAEVGIAEDLQGVVSLGALNGYVQVRGELSGYLEVLEDVDKTTAGPAIRVEESLTGQIRVYGPLDADPNEADVIQIGGAMPFPGAFTVDFDGYDEDDDWDSRAYVLVEQSDPNDPNSGPARYNGNSPAVRVYRVTSCLGDMQNDASVNMYDITYFVAAQTGPDQYAAIAPGLEGSMVYHCDVNEDGTCDFGDINCFVYLVTHQICGPCPGEDDRGEPPSPQELAKQLADNVWPELYDDLVWVVGQAIDWQKTQELREYWTAVYNALTE